MFALASACASRPPRPSLQFRAAPSVLHHAPHQARLHLALPRYAPLAQASDALHVRATRPSALLLVRPFAPYKQLLRPLLTSRSGSAPSPFQAQSEISPGKNALLHRTTAAFTPLRLDHESFTVSCPLALLGSAFYAVLVHRLAIYAPRFLPTLGRPHAVALHFICRGQLMAGLAPAGMRPCWAHKTKGAASAAPFSFTAPAPAKSTGLPTATFCGFGPSCPVSRLRLNT